jgi:O-antigen ligase
MLRQNAKAKRVWRAMVIGLVSLSALVFALDFMSGYAITHLGAPNADDGDTIQNLSHGLSTLMLCLPVVFILLWDKGLWGRMLAGIVVLLTVITCIISGNSAAIMAIISLMTVLFFGMKRPKTILGTTFIIPIALLVFAPILALFASTLGEGGKAALPFSWEWRVETWSYLWNKIVQNPLIGSGFDSLRSFSDTFDARGFEGLSTVNMHAHNFGLHIWTETGIIGAALGVIALWLCAQNLRNSDWLTRRRTAAICATLIAATCFASLSYSAWNDWWLGAIFMAFSLTTLIDQH